MEADAACQRDAFRYTGGVFYASPYPRPIPGVPVERNLSGVSFAVANVSGLAAGSQLTTREALMRGCQRMRRKLISREGAKLAKEGVVGLRSLGKFSWQAKAPAPPYGRGSGLCALFSWMARLRSHGKDWIRRCWCRPRLKTLRCRQSGESSGPCCV